MMRTKQNGFTLIELLAFILISGLMMSTLMIGARTSLLKTRTVHAQLLATQTAQKCLEWFLQQRRMNGYSTFSCPSTPTPTQCSAPTGLTVSTSIACTTWNGDNDFKTITVSVTGNATTSLSVQVGDY